MKGERVDNFYTISEAISRINKARDLDWTWRELLQASLKDDVGLVCYVENMPVIDNPCQPEHEDKNKRDGWRLLCFSGYFAPLETDDGREYIYRLSHGVPIEKGISTFEGTQNGKEYNFFEIADVKALAKQEKINFDITCNYAKLHYDEFGLFGFIPRGEFKPSIYQFYIDKFDSIYFEMEKKSSVTTRGITRNKIVVTTSLIESAKLLKKNTHFMSASMVKVAQQVFKNAQAAPQLVIIDDLKKDKNTLSNSTEKPKIKPERLTGNHERQRETILEEIGLLKLKAMELVYGEKATIRDSWTSKHRQSKDVFEKRWTELKNMKLVYSHHRTRKG